MVNVIGGLAAADGFYRAQDQQRDRDFQDKQRAYQVATMQAGLDSLPERMAAETSGYKLSAARNAAGLETLPTETANRSAQLGLDSDDLSFRGQMQPVRQAIESARDHYTMQNQESENATSQAMKLNERQLAAIRSFGNFVQNNDKSGALQVANAWASTEALRQGTKGKNFVDIRPVGANGPEGDTRAYQLVAEDGSTFELPFSGIERELAKVKTGNYGLHQGPAGDITVWDKNTGKTKVVREADERYARSTNTGAKPAQLQLAEALMSAPENKGMTLTEALAIAKTGTEKPRHQFIIEMVGKNALPGSDQQAEYRKWGALYDQAKGESQKRTPSASSSNRTAAPTIDPAYEALFNSP